MPKTWRQQIDQYFQKEIRILRQANGEAGLRLALVDLHSTLESVLRAYLAEECRVAAARDMSTSFPALVDALAQSRPKKCSPRSARLLKTINARRNAIVHHKGTVSVEEMRSFLQGSGAFMKSLSGYRPRGVSGRSSPRPPIRRPAQRRTARQRRQLWLLGVALLLLGLAAVYWFGWIA